MRLSKFYLVLLMLLAGCAATDGEDANSTVTSSSPAAPHVVFASDLQKGPYQQTVLQILTNPQPDQNLPVTMDNVTMYSSYVSATGNRCNILGAQVSNRELPLLACQVAGGGWNVEPALVSSDSIFFESPQ